ncbi:MAG TPA: hypothetical protein VN618_12385 [Solirubrobacteraceae bacterium]|nr:hypothetical protein [Solirubrobacteraceae bacterium]
MPWASFDDGIHGDPRVLDAGLAAAGLYLCVTSYMARYLTDGVIPAKAVRQMLEDGDASPLDALLRTGLLVESLGDDYEAPEFLKANRSREQVEDERAKTAERKRRWKEKKKREQGRGRG